MDIVLQKINKIITRHGDKSLIGLADISETEYREFKRVFDQVVLKPKDPSVAYADRAFIIAVGTVLFDMFEHEDSKYWESLARKYYVEEKLIRDTVTQFMDHFYSTRKLPAYETTRNEYVETIKMQSIISKNRIGNLTQVFYTIYLNDLERDISPYAVNMLAKFLRNLFKADIQGGHFDLKYNGTKMSEMRQLLPKAFMRAYVTNTNAVAKIMYEFFKYFDAVHTGVPYSGKLNSRLKMQLEEELKKYRYRYPELTKGKKKQSSVDENKARLVKAKKKPNRILGVAIPKHFVELDDQGRQDAKVKLYTEKKLVRTEKLKARQGGIAWRTLPKTINFNQDYPYLRYEVVGNDKVYYDSKDELYTEAEKKRLEEIKRRETLNNSEIIKKKSDPKNTEDKLSKVDTSVVEIPTPDLSETITKSDSKEDAVSPDYQILLRTKNGYKEVEASALATGEFYDLKLDNRNDVTFKNTSYEMTAEGYSANYHFYLNNDSFIMINKKIINLDQKKRRMGFSEISREAHVRYKGKAHQIVFHCHSFYFPTKTGYAIDDYIFKINDRIMNTETLEKSIIQNGMTNDSDWNGYYVFDFTEFIKKYERCIKVEIRLRDGLFIVFQCSYYHLEKLSYAFFKAGKNVRKSICVEMFRVGEVVLTPENRGKYSVRMEEGCFLFHLSIEAQPITIAVNLDNIKILEKDNHLGSIARFDWRGHLLPSDKKVKKLDGAQTESQSNPVIHPNIRDIHEDIYLSAVELLNGIEKVDTLIKKLMSKYPSESELATRAKVQMYKNIIFDESITMLPDNRFIHYMLDRIKSENADGVLRYVVGHLYRCVERNVITKETYELRRLLLQYSEYTDASSRSAEVGNH